MFIYSRYFVPIFLLLATASLRAENLSGRQTILAKIKEVPDGKFTYGDPPKVTVTVTETLEGSLKGELTLQWSKEVIPRGGDGIGDRQWLATPVVIPKVGDQYLIRLSSADSRRLNSEHLATKSREFWLFNDKNRDDGLAAIKKMDDEYKAMMERFHERNLQSEADAKARAAKIAEDKAAWIAAIKPEQITDAFKKSDFVAIGTTKVTTSSGGNFTFTISEILKGKETNVATFLIDKKVAPFITSDGSKYILFLTEEIKTARRAFLPPVYKAIGDGLVPASEANIKTVRAATQPAAAP